MHKTGITLTLSALLIMALAIPAVANHTPTITITSPGDEATLPAGTTSATIAGALGAGENPAQVTVTVNGVQKYASEGNITGAWSFLLEGLANGETYVVVATGTHSGNVGSDTITFKVDTAAPNNPETKEDCFDDGWIQYGFVNQGQCVRFVTNGKDSR